MPFKQLLYTQFRKYLKVHKKTLNNKKKMFAPFLTKHLYMKETRFKNNKTFSNCQATC